MANKQIKAWREEADRKERRETEGIRVALAVEARWLVGTMIETHAVLVNMVKIRETSAIRSFGQVPTAELERARASENTVRSIGRLLGELRNPVVYPACADRIGTLGPRLAEGFYGNYQHLQFLGRVIFDDPNQAPTSPELARTSSRSNRLASTPFPCSKNCRQGHEGAPRPARPQGEGRRHGESQS
jgi:hypothetical protein